MTDRQPTYPGRVELTDVETGEKRKYDMVMADEPTELGTSPVKANLLSDETANLYDLSKDNATVNTALAASFLAVPTIKLNNVYTNKYAIKQNISAIQVAATNLAAASGVTYAFFGGGSYGASQTNTVNAYDKNLSMRGVSGLSYAREVLAAAKAGNYVLFAGGYGYGAQSVGTVDTYSNTLVKGVAADLSSPRSYLAGACIGNYAIFAGGANYTSVTDAYNENLVKTSISPITYSAASISSVSGNIYAIFAGGQANAMASTGAACAYSSNLVVRSLPAMTNGRFNMGSAIAGNYAIFFGGRTCDGVTTAVDAYNETDLVRTQLDYLPTPITDLAGSEIGDSAIFAGGRTSLGSDFSDKVYVYDPNLVKKEADPLTNGGRSNLKAAKIGNFAIFAGGATTASVNYTDAFAQGYTTRFTIPGFSAYKFDGFHEKEMFTLEDLLWESTDFDSGITGYIRRGGFTLSGLI